MKKNRGGQKKKKEAAKKNLLFEIVLSLIYVSAFLLLYGLHIMPEEVYAKKITINSQTYLGEETFENILAEIVDNESEFFSQKINWQSGIGSADLSLSDLEAESNISDIKDYFDTFFADQSLLSRAKIILFGKELNYEINFDSEKLQSIFKSRGLDIGPKNATYILQDGKVAIRKEELSYEIDEEEFYPLANTLFYDVQAPAILTAEAPLKEIEPDFTEEKLNEYITQAQEISLKSLTLKSDKGETWILKMSDHISWLFPVSYGSYDYDYAYQLPFDIYPEDLTAFLGQEINALVNRDSSPVFIKEENEDYVFDGSARKGQKVDEAALKSKILEALNQNISEIDIPLSYIKPQVDVPESLKNAGITDLIGVGYSSLKGSPSNRLHNIYTGVSKFNGLLVGVGEEFSFTKNLGHVDAVNGFLPELVIKGDETIPEYGGGLCQVSTTAYRAALYSGVPITMRTNHSYAVSYYAYPYGYGLDATIYEPLPDIRFINDTAGSILIQSYVDGTDVYFVFYGTDDGRSVKMEGPSIYGHNSIAETETIYTDELEPGERKLKEYAHTGFQTDWYRSVFNADGSIRIDNERIHSNYEARPAKYYEGKVLEDTSTDGAA